MHTYTEVIITRSYTLPYILKFQHNQLSLRPDGDTQPFSCAAILKSVPAAQCASDLLYPSMNRLKPSNIKTCSALIACA